MKIRHISVSLRFSFPNKKYRRRIDGGSSTPALLPKNSPSENHH